MMKLRIALAGELPSDPQIFSRIDLLLGQISGYLCRENTKTTMQLLVSPSYSGKTWITWNETRDFPMCTYNLQADDAYVEQCAQLHREEGALRSLLGENMCDSADVLLAVWNEDVTELSGATWEFLRIAYDKKAPCIWISSKSKNVYCLWDSYYKEYSPAYLDAVCEPLPEEEIQPSPIEPEGKILSFWEKLRVRYLKKHKANISIHPSESDCMLDADFRLEKEASEGEKVRGVLLEKWNQFDAAAIELNSRFQAMIYQRSILPFMATLFLAVGFYAGSVLGKPLSGLIILIVKDAETAQAIAENITVAAGLLAGVGFLIHGMLNLYVYRLSKSQTIYHWQSDFVKNRYMAELLRVLIHFKPYGVELDLRKLCGDDRKIYNAVKHLADEEEPLKQEVNQQKVGYLLQHIKELLEDQISYHEFSVKRYQSIVASLETWWKRIFYIGFIMVIGRGILQFMLAVSPLENAYGFELNSIASSFLNMLALLLPAWAGYFSTKVQQNNFRYNLNNHQNMLRKLRKMQERVERLADQEPIPMEVFQIMAGELAEVMLVEDTSEWKHQYMNSVVKPL